MGSWGLWVVGALVLGVGCGDDDGAPEVDAGGRVEAGPRDAGGGEDAPPGMDAGVDAAAGDAATPMDAGAGGDAATSMDAGAGEDAATSMDAGAGEDAATSMDAGAGEDAATSMDAGADAGPPPDAGPGGPIVGLSAGQAHVCAVQSAGTVRCWGDNTDGQLGDGTTTDRLVPTVIPGLANVVEVAAGGNHTCARHRDGTISCWGDNGFGQLGDGTVISRTTPRTVGGISGAVRVVAGGGDTAFGRQGHVCVLLSDATIRCWGNGQNWQLDGGRVPFDSPVPVMGPALTGVIDIAAGSRHTVALHADGTVSCWGDTAYGQCSIGRGGMIGPAMTIPGIDDATALAASGARNCVVRGINMVSCWGAEIRVGRPSGMIVHSPVPSLDVRRITEISVGAVHTVVQFARGNLQAFGYDDVGQLGDGPVDSTGVDGRDAVDVPGIDTAITQTSGWDFSVVALGDGSVVAWGVNTDGQLGTGDTTSTDAPVPVMW